jgi:hypothetical protein
MPFKNQHPLYYVWKSMRDRCRNPKNRQWNYYGGRGISICERWDHFPTFVADMGERPPGHSLDRIDNDLGYSPENCRWADRKTQQRNQRRAVYVEIEGARYRAIELAEKHGVKFPTVVSRATRGLPLAEVVQPGKIYNLSGLALGGIASGARQQAKTHCAKGHEFTPQNTSITPQGWRRCRACHAAKMRARNAAKRAGR